MAFDFGPQDVESLKRGDVPDRQRTVAQSDVGKLNTSRTRQVTVNSSFLCISKKTLDTSYENHDSGRGKLRRLDTQTLCALHRVGNYDPDLYHVPGEKNPANIYTKPNIPHASRRKDGFSAAMHVMRVRFWKT